MNFAASSDKKNDPAETRSKFDYNFSEDEIKLLARFFRKNQFDIPSGLEKFSREIELFLYNSSSIEEVENLFR